MAAYQSTARNNQSGNTTPSRATGRTSSSGNEKAFVSARDDDTSWVRTGYGVVIGSSYANFRESLKQQMIDLLQTTGNAAEKANPEATAERLLQESEGGQYPGNEKNELTASDFNAFQYKTNSVSDASIGGNDAINPYAAFGLDDDIVHDVSKVASGKYYYGMGRCYYEMYESKQQILYLTMGVPKYRNLRTWLQNATVKELCELNDTGSVSLSTKLGYMFKNGLSLAIRLPWLPLIWTYKAMTGIKDYRVTEYFYFRDTMPLFYRYMNTIMSELAVSMGIYGNAETNGANISPDSLRTLKANLPAIMQNGPDIFKIMSKRASRMGGDAVTTITDSVDPNSADALLNQAKDPQEPKTQGNFLVKGLKNFWTGIQTGALEGMNFIGFRVERSDNANESFGNQTSDSPLLKTLNAEVEKNREQNLGAEGAGEGLMSSLSKLSSKVNRAVAAATNLMKGPDAIKGTIAYMASGNGYFDLPKQWSQSSGMSRTINYNMKLRAKTGGDNVSIYQSIMIPLSAVLAAALPRAAGDSTFTAPFIVRAFCKGMYCIPAGIIQSLSITRGGGEYGWSINHLPTTVDVSMTIEDLSPMLFLSISAGSGKTLGLGIDTIMQSFANNTKMHEYIATLSGIGAKERYYLMGQLKRRMTSAMLINRNTVFSATYQGYVLGDSSFVRSLMAVTPFTRIRNN